MTDQSVIVKKADCEADFTWLLPLAIDPDQFAARQHNAAATIAAP
jgi:hypothetical protein